MYAVDPKKIDNDPVMTKILDKPIIAWSILINIHKSAKRKGKLDELRGTRIHTFFMSNPFQTYLKEMAKTPTSKAKANCGCN